LAPSAVNIQPWKFIVVDDKDTRDKLVKAAFRGIFSFNQWAAKVPTFVVVVIDKHGLLSNVMGMVRDTLRSLLDIGIATEHLVLQADGVLLAREQVDTSNTWGNLPYYEDGEHTKTRLLYATSGRRLTLESFLFSIESDS
jgi:nitroreductase